MADDPALKDHQTWLNYIRPEGLVVSAAALVDAQVVLDRAALGPLQERLRNFTDEIELDDAIAEQIPDFPSFLRNFLEWPQEFIFGLDPTRPIPDELTVPLPEFGETLTADYALRAARPKEGENPWLMLVKVLPAGADLDSAHSGPDERWSASAARRFERLMRETRVPIGLLTNAVTIRLIYAPYGENSGSLTFNVAEMGEVAGRPMVGALHLLLSRYRLFGAPTQARLAALLEKSRQYQSSVSIALAGQVLDALYELVRGFQAADERARGELLREVLATHPDDVYAGLLTVLLRLVFLLYAEDRDLMPAGPLYANHYSVRGLFHRLRGDHERNPDTMDHRYGAWAQLLVLFRAVHGGCRHPQLKIPARKGYLFDPDRYPFLEGAGRVPLVADGVIFRVLRKLLMLEGEALSYKTLDVEQIGSVYETMMGFRLETTAGTTIAMKPAKAHGAPIPIDLDALLGEMPAERAKWLAANGELKLTGQAADALKQARSIDDLLAAMERRVARGATPHPLSKGAMVLQPTDERRRTGSHYTPRKLTEPIVRTALRPILKRLGARPSPEQILELKICDIAVGSGAFLVEACRQLGDELVAAWHNHGRMPYIPPDEDEVLHARRIVAQRCLYGVDRNPMAVDLAKLSLWLATLAREHPFTFLDHSLRCGDSLVGVSRRQLADFHWRDEPMQVLGQDKVGNPLRTATAARKEILEADEEFVSPETKRQKLDLADDALNPVRLAGDMVVAAYFAADKDRDRLAARDEYLHRYTEFYRTYDISKSPDAIVAALRAGPFPIRAFHWEVEFPEVFDRPNGGFDAIIGNPPFLGGKRISTVLGDAYRDWLGSVHDEASSNSDLVGHFFRRAYNLLRKEGASGLVATNTIAQGDTRHTGLRWICTHGGTIFAARKRHKWEAGAAVVVSVVHVIKGKFAGPPMLDGKPVERISAFLFHRGGDEDPKPLRANESKSFVGCYVLGMGFTFDDTNPEATSIAEMHRLIAKDPRNAERIFPYIGGEEVNDSPTQAFHRYVIDFFDMPESEARKWPDLMAIVEAKVKPIRLPLKRAALVDRWWQYAEKRPGLRAAIRGLNRVLVINCGATPHVAFAFLPSGVIVAHTLVVLPLPSWNAFGTLQSRVHEVWARFFGSSMKDDLRYTPTDCFETFPLLPNYETCKALDEAGQEYYEFRAALMVQNNEGLTKTYNRFHDPNETSPDIARLRELHAAMDRAVLDAYGWTDLDPVCDFILEYEDDSDDDSSSRRKKPYRYRWPDDLRDEVLARLLALNAARAEKEALSEPFAPNGKLRHRGELGRKGELVPPFRPKGLL